MPSNLYCSPNEVEMGAVRFFCEELDLQKWCSKWLKMRQKWWKKVRKKNKRGGIGDGRKSRGGNLR